MDVKISKQAKDILQKHISALFKDKVFEFYGIKTAKIKEVISVELPDVEITETSMDFVFLLEDETYLHIEFQSTYDKDDLIRFSIYDLRLYKRDKRKVQTIIIYSADVKKINETLNIGSLEYAPVNVMMYDYDGNAIYSELENKLKSGQEINDIDIINLIFLPLMRNNLPKYELAKKSIETAQTISDKNKRDTIIASAFAFSYKYLSENDIKQLLEVVK